MCSRVESSRVNDTHGSEMSRSHLPEGMCSEAGSSFGVEVCSSLSGGVMSCKLADLLPLCLAMAWVLYKLRALMAGSLNICRCLRVGRWVPCTSWVWMQRIWGHYGFQSAFRE